MKRILLSLVYCAIVLLANAQTGSSSGPTPITFTTGYVDPTLGGNINNPKSPMQPPTVYLDGHDLLFAQCFGDDVAVELRDSSDSVVYSGSLLAGDQQLQLPTSLTGDYTLILYIGNWVFSGEVSL